MLIFSVKCKRVTRGGDNKVSLDRYIRRGNGDFSAAVVCHTHNLQSPAAGRCGERKRGLGETLRRILLVEDDPGVGPLLEYVLLSEGYSVHLVETVAEAVLLLESRAYDLVLTDVMLPDGSGLGIADAAKARDIKTLVITGHAFRVPAEELARHDVLTKPLRPRQLVEAVKGRFA